MSEKIFFHYEKNIGKTSVFPYKMSDFKETKFPFKSSLLLSFKKEVRV